MKKYYSGPDYVDWIGIDGYNWQAQNVDEMIGGLYHAVVQHPDIFGDKPIMMAEWGMAESLTDQQTKAQWLTEAFDKIKNDYPKIRAFYWFQVNKEHDWRLNETPEAWDVFKQAMQDPVFVGCDVE